MESLNLTEISEAVYPTDRHFFEGDTNILHALCDICGQSRTDVIHTVQITGAVDLTPDVLKTADGRSLMDARLQALESATAEVANVLTALYDDFQVLLRANVPADYLHQIAALIGARERAREAFIRTFSGRE